MFFKLTKDDQVRKKMHLTSFTRKNQGLEIDHPFSSGDTLFTCGLDWDNRILEKVQRIKKQININVVTVVYDFIPILSPEFIQNQIHVDKLIGHFTLLAEISDLVIVNTNVTKKNLENFCETLDLIIPNIFVTLWGAGFSSAIEPFEVGELSAKRVDKGFLLCVGTVEIRKNYQLILNIIRLSLEKSIPVPHFVIVGAAGWGANDLMWQLKNDEYLQEKVTWLEGTSDAELIWLYKNCEAFLSTSFTEGFGLPVYEAQFYEKNIFLSDIPVYRELFPDAFFISPNDPALWLKVLSTNLQDSKTIKNPISWNDSVKSFIEEVNRVFDCNLESQVNNL
jgi:glycosyltransferase involved in cell wall biosynthesis